MVQIHVGQPIHSVVTVKCISEPEPIDQSAAFRKDKTGQKPLPSPAENDASRIGGQSIQPMEKRRITLPVGACVNSATFSGYVPRQSERQWLFRWFADAAGSGKREA
jgi:hypothetical protein